MSTRRKLYVKYTVTAEQRRWTFETIALIARLQDPGFVDSAAKEDLEHRRHIDANHFLEETDLGFSLSGTGDVVEITDRHGWCQPESVAVFLQGLLKSTGDERVLHGTYSEESTANDTVDFSGGFFVVDQDDYTVESASGLVLQRRKQFLMANKQKS